MPRAAMLRLPGTRRALPHRASVPLGLRHPGSSRRCVGSSGRCSVVSSGRAASADGITSTQNAERRQGGSHADRHHRRAPGTRGLRAAACSPTAARWLPTGPSSRRRPSRAPPSGRTWRTWAGWASTCPRRYGGAGAGLGELVVVLDEIGRQVAPGPFLPTVLASAVIAQCGSEEQQAALLPGLADGSVVAALGLGRCPHPGGRGARRRRRGRPRRSGGRPRPAAGRRRHRGRAA